MGFRKKINSVRRFFDTVLKSFRQNLSAINLLCIGFFVIPAIQFFGVNLGRFSSFKLITLIMYCALLAVVIIICSKVVRRLRINDSAQRLIQSFVFSIPLFWYVNFFYEDLLFFLRDFDFMYGVLPKLLIGCFFILFSIIIAWFAHTKIAVRNFLLLYCAINLAIAIGGVASRASTQFLSNQEDPLAPNNSAETVVDDQPTRHDLSQEALDRVDFVKIKRNVNVYFVITDQMASLGTLKEDLLDEVDVHTSAMEANGFILSEDFLSTTNITYLTLASIFRMDSLVPFQQGFSNRLRFFPKILNVDTDNRLGRFLRTNNYDFYHVGNPWHACEPENTKSTSTDCLNFFGFEFQGAQIPYHVRSFVVGTYVGLIWSKVEKLFWPEGTGEQGLATFNKFLQTMPGSIKANQFFFVHHLRPHSPHVDSSCMLKNPNSIVDDNTFGYLSSVQCLFKELDTFGRLIKQLDPSAIVVVQGDHSAGRGRFEVGDFRNKLDTINWYRAPDNCIPYFNKVTSTVGSIRAVINCLADDRIMKQETFGSHFISGYEGQEGFGKLRPVMTRAHVK